MAQPGAAAGTAGPAAAPAPAPAPVMSAAERNAILRAMTQRVQAWKNVKRPNALKDFFRMSVPAGYDHSAKTIVGFLKENCHGIRMPRRDPAHLDDIENFYQADRDYKMDLGDDLAELELKLSQYLARLDRDFFFGLLSSPAPLYANRDVWMPGGPLPFAIVVHNEYDNPNLDSSNKIRRSVVGGWLAEKKQIHLWTQFLGITEPLYQRTWTEDEFSKLKLKLPVFTRTFDMLVDSLVHELCHLFIDVVGYYDQDGLWTRTREVTDDTFHGEQWHELYAFIITTLSGWAPESDWYQSQAARATKRKEDFRKGWADMDRLMGVGQAGDGGGPAGDDSDDSDHGLVPDRVIDVDVQPVKTSNPWLTWIIMGIVVISSLYLVGNVLTQLCGFEVSLSVLDPIEWSEVLSFPLAVFVLFAMIIFFSFWLLRPDISGMMGIFRALVFGGVFGRALQYFLSDYGLEPNPWIYLSWTQILGLVMLVVAAFWLKRGRRQDVSMIRCS
ncbi:hypothetical protein SUNI508_02441 [Seiridium unicorne]|uniref:Uncharacterized protein n=1 Tax=Seiridium unicorne TaxID=138068 RepID=A0ABR2UF45_9PEZI